MIDYLQTMADEVKAIFSHDIETTKTFVVPGRDDVGLTFGRDQIKRGKLIETCVLFIDVRNSTSISRRLRKDKPKLGKIYSGFIHSMASTADKYGFVRNIIGDRIMVVFQPGNCFVDAINCAVTMYSISKGILKKYSGLEDFKVGIGIEFGEMLVLKTGIVKHHEEQSEYKNLVWVGDAANIASKLTDFANKEYDAPQFNVTYEDVYSIQVPKLKSDPLTPLERFLGQSQYELQWIKSPREVTLSTKEYLAKISFTNEGAKYDGKKLIAVRKEEKIGTASPILMSGKVYTEFKKADPKSIHLKNLFQRSYPSQPYTSSGVYGGSPFWIEVDQVK